mmetsp:Transcript_34281/g.90441  ORF Transcript_34281/g.90441 Transcript_34281/m.90441 type:complete len:209 (+) Transcript_34281:2704-3330(+)
MLASRVGHPPVGEQADRNPDERAGHRHSEEEFDDVPPVDLAHVALGEGAVEIIFLRVVRVVVDTPENIEDDECSTIVHERLARDLHGKLRTGAQLFENGDYRHGVGSGQYRTEREAKRHALGEREQIPGEKVVSREAGAERAKDDTGAREQQALKERALEVVRVEDHGITEKQGREERVKQHVPVDLVPHVRRLLERRDHEKIRVGGE